MNTRALKLKAVQFAVDQFLGSDDNGISIFDRIVGVVERKSKEHSGNWIEENRQILLTVQGLDNLGDSKLSDNEIIFAVQLARLILEGRP